MSRNIGHIVFQSDHSVGYFIYNGTVEQCFSKIYSSIDNANIAFREGTFTTDQPSCDCGRSEPVIIVPYDYCCDNLAHTLLAWRGVPEVSVYSLWITTPRVLYV